MNSSGNYRRLLIFLLLTMTLSGITQAQHILVKAGAGIPEITGISGGMQKGQLQIVGGVGYLPLQGEYMLSVNYNMYYHFMGSSSKSDIKPWYGRMSFCFFREETENWVDKMLYLDARLGRTMFLTEKISLELDLGVALELAYNRDYKVQTSSWVNLHFPVLPAFGLRFVYRFVSS